MQGHPLAEVLGLLAFLAELILEVPRGKHGAFLASALLRDCAFMVAKCEADHLGAVSDAAVELVVSEGGGLARFRRCQ